MFTEQDIVQRKAEAANIFAPIFDTKVTEYLCSGWVFFLQTNFEFLTSLFDGSFLYHSKGIVVLRSI